MACRCAIPTDEFHGWECSITGGACIFFYPDQQSCHEAYGDVGDPETEDILEYDD